MDIKFVMLISFFVSFQLTQQKGYSQTPKNCRNCGDTARISDTSFNKYINKAFSVVATGQGTAADLVNYGSFEPVNGSFKFNISGPLRNPRNHLWTPYFSFSAGGSISDDNVAVFFSDTKFSSGMNISGKINLPIGRPYVTYDLRERLRFSQKVRQLNDEVTVQLNGIEQRADTNYIDSQIKNLNDKLGIRLTQDFLAKISLPRIADSIDKTQKLRANLAADIANSKNDVKALRSLVEKAAQTDSILSKYYDSTVYFKSQLQALYKDTMTLNRQLDSVVQLRCTIQSELKQGKFTVSDYYLYEKYKIDSAYANKRAALEDAFPFEPGNFSWLSVVATVEGKKFYTYFDSLAFENRINKNEFTAYTLGLEFNYYRYFNGLKHAHFFNLGFVRIKENTLDDLTTMELVTETKFIDSNTIHTLSKKYDVYTKPVNEYRAWKLYTNYYYYFGQRTTYSVHIFPDVEFRSSKVTPINFGLGFIFSFKNKKDSAIVNLEVYGKLVDIGKALPTDEPKFYRRNEFGIHFAVPLGFSFGSPKS